MTTIDGKRLVRAIRKAVHVRKRTIIRSASGSSSAGTPAPEIPDDGGARIVVSEAEPDSALYEQGDVWVETSSAAEIIAFHVHIGGDWAEFVITSDDHLVFANEADEPDSASPEDPAPGSIYGKISVNRSLKKGVLFSGGGNVVTLEWPPAAMLGFRHKQILSANPGASPYVTFPGISAVTVTSPATPAAADVAAGAAVLFGTLGNQNSDCSLVADTGVTALLWMDWLIAIGGMFGVKAVTSVRNWWGIFSGDPAASDTPSVQMAAFRFSTSASDSNWQAVASDGTNISVQDTGVAASTNQILFPEIHYDSDAGELHYYLDGSLVKTIGGTYVPDLQTNLNFRVQARALGGLPVPNPPNPSFVRNILFGYTGIILR